MEWLEQVRCIKCVGCVGYVGDEQDKQTVTYDLWETAQRMNVIRKDHLR